MYTGVQHDFHFIWCLCRWKATGLARCHCRSRWCLCRLKATGPARCHSRCRWCLCRLKTTKLAWCHYRCRWCLCRLKATGLARCHCRCRWCLCRLKLQDWPGVGAGITNHSGAQLWITALFGYSWFILDIRNARVVKLWLLFLYLDVWEFFILNWF